MKKGFFIKVVICFQNCIFDISETTTSASKPNRKLLWFAFKIVSLTYRKQPIMLIISLQHCCDLLSKLYLWHIGNNKNDGRTPTLVVVICFQNCIFDISETTWGWRRVQSTWLWFAFKIVSLTYRKQLARELPSLAMVVICFQNCIFDISETTMGLILQQSISLWFAFKIVSLTYRKQQVGNVYEFDGVVICFQNCIFDISETTRFTYHVVYQRIKS